VSDDSAAFSYQSALPKRKDDRCILRGIMHVLTSGCRWIDRPEYGHINNLQSLSLLECAGIWKRIYGPVAARLNHNQSKWMLDSAHVKAHRCAGGGEGPWNRAIEIIKRGRNRMIQRLAEKLCRPQGL